MNRRIEVMCPHCGKLFDILLCHDSNGLIPNHAYPETPVGGRLCPGSMQGPRNPESDKRPLWKDQDDMARMGAFIKPEDTPGQPCRPNGFGLCMTHPTCKHVKHALKEAQAKIDDQRRELQARREILDAVCANAGYEGNCWSSAAEIDWRQRLRDFACDRELHQIDRESWESYRGHGITLYAHADFFVAYWDDAAELWQHADDTRPMFHCMGQSDPPHKTVIHSLYLAAWVQHLASIKLPVQIMDLDDLERIDEQED